MKKGKELFRSVRFMLVTLTCPRRKKCSALTLFPLGRQCFFRREHESSSGFGWNNLSCWFSCAFAAGEDHSERRAGFHENLVFPVTRVCAHINHSAGDHGSCLANAWPNPLLKITYSGLHSFLCDIDFTFLPISSIQIPSGSLTNASA